MSEERETMTLEVGEQGTPHRPTVYLCRHGATALNAGGRLRGLSDPDLDATGRRQADALAAALQPMEPRAVVASPLLRAVHTAEAIAAACGLTVEVSEDLLDRDYGPQNGRLIEDVITSWGSVDDAPGVEPLASVLVRARSALAMATARILDGPIVLVGHDAVNSSLLAWLDPGRWSAPAEVPQPTGCLNVLQHEGGTWSVVVAGLRPPFPLPDVPPGA
jgi:broad specificity phosphatase PhoE